MIGVVHRTDLFKSLYDYDLKCIKWWENVFYCCLGIVAVNAWILCNNLERKN